MGFDKSNPTAENVGALFSPSGTNQPAKWLQVSLSSGNTNAFAVAVQTPRQWT